MRTPLSFTASEQEVTWSGKDARFSFTQSCALRWLASAECEEMRRELENARLLEELAALRAEKVRAEEALRAEAADLRERILDLEAEVILFLNTSINK